MARSVRALEFDPEAHSGRRKPTPKSCPLASIHALWHDSDPFIFLAGRLPDSSGCGVGVGGVLESYRVVKLSGLPEHSFLQRWPAGSTAHAKFSLFPGIVYRECTKVSLALTWTDSASGIGHVLWEFWWPFLHHLTACHPVWKDLTKRTLSWAWNLHRHGWYPCPMLRNIWKILNFLFLSLCLSGEQTSPKCMLYLTIS